ncbi:tartrate dehydrogenase [Paenibacillus alginolyticus]|uniref:tartrate dehydrogenase n=1 Tax=Paenibacillus alginolyticus TaxID=59839 RepID=UPI00041CCBF4|nr:tartrate dehydrogenase [Paenibacillus alginolyticus]MCY9666757.1 tartrate dehydrogenase [Paenibacillus alginolyticus]
MNKYEIAVIPGDGIGKEVVPFGVKALQLAADIHGGFSFRFEEFPWSCEYYVKHGRMMPENGIDILKNFEAIFLGAVGLPQTVPDHVSLWGLLIAIRREMKQYINLRPVRQMRGVRSPLAAPNDFDILVVRENAEGEYSPIGGRMAAGNDEIVVQNAVFTRSGTERAVRYAFELANKREKKFVTSATKSNGIIHSMPFWDEVFQGVGQEYPEIKQTSTHIDALSAFFVTKPHTLDVVVASNLFGDILTDLGAAIMGSIGIAPSANINPERKFPSMFEPVHGSAPDIFGKGIANPVGQIWSAKMVLDFFGYEDIGQLLLDSIEDTMEAGIITPDLGGTANTAQVGEAILQKLKERGNE